MNPTIPSRHFTDVGTGFSSLLSRPGLVHGSVADKPRAHVAASHYFFLPLRHNRGTGQCRNIFSAVDPNNALARLVRPLEPMTTRSAPTSLAISINSINGIPTPTSGLAPHSRRRRRPSKTPARSRNNCRADDTLQPDWGTTAWHKLRQHGHDYRKASYEIRGGIHIFGARRLFSFTGGRAGRGCGGRA